MSLTIDARLLTLKAATRELYGLLGGLEGAAATAEKSTSVMHRYGDRHSFDRFIPASDIAALEAVAPRPVMTMALAKLAGGLFVPHIDLTADEGTIGHLVMRLAKELGDVSGEIAGALADGKLDPGEALGVLHQMDELDVVSRQLRGLLERVSHDG